MDKANHSKKETTGKKEENWIDDLMERQKKDLEQEEEILSSVPNRIKHKWLNEEEE